MKHYRKELWFNIAARMDFVNITPQVEEALKESGVQEGLCLINSMNITASVFINDHESGLHHDYKKWLEELAPFNPSPETYRHNRTGEDNADATLNAKLWGGRLWLLLQRGSLILAPGNKSSMGNLTASAAANMCL